jgi:hypothetical protein
MSRRIVRTYGVLFRIEAKAESRSLLGEDNQVMVKLHSFDRECNVLILFTFDLKI